MSKEPGQLGDVIMRWIKNPVAVIIGFWILVLSGLVYVVGKEHHAVFERWTSCETKCHSLDGGPYDVLRTDEHECWCNLASKLVP